MRAVLVCLLMVFPVLGQAAATNAELFALIEANDVPGMKAVLNEAIAEDSTGQSEPEHQRDVFDFFMNSHPAIASFTADWLAKEPEDGLAITARAWHLYGMGWAFRGNGFADQTTPDSMRKMRSLHREAYSLFHKAVLIAPDLLSASDGLLVLPATLRKIEDVPIEMERIMTLQPNRGSLMRAMYAFTPQWGGKMRQISLLCERYAKLVTTVPGYTQDICEIDAVYDTRFPIGPARQAAHQRLIAREDPILNYARLKDAEDGQGTAAWRLVTLEDQMDIAPLTAEQATAYDFAFAAAMTPCVTGEQTEYINSLPAEIARWREKADYDPFNAGSVMPYVAYLKDYNQRLAAGASGPDVPLDPVDIARRMERLLAENPYSGQAWLELAQYHLGRDQFGQADLAGIEAATPYFENANFYSRHDLAVLKAVVFAMMTKVILTPYDKELVDISALSPEELAETDRVVHCPLTRLLILNAFTCIDNGVPLVNCSDGIVDSALVFDRLMQADARQECPALRAGMPANMVAQANVVDLHSVQP